MQRLIHFVRAPRWPLTAAVVCFSLSGGAARADTSAEARKHVEQGLDAIRQSDYEQADRLFQEAHAEGGAEVYHDIGLAEADIPGRELRAVCWLAAYLAAEPKASDAADVRSVIEALDAKSRDKISHLLRSLQDAVEGMPAGESRNYALRDMVGRWADLGDYVAAKRAVSVIQDPNTRSDALNNLARAYSGLIREQVRTGDLAGARASLTEAQTAADSIPNRYTNMDGQYQVATAWAGVAQGQLRVGDLEGMQESLSVVQRFADTIDGRSSSNDLKREAAALQVALAKAQFKAGDASRSGDSLRAALQTVEAMPEAPWPWRLDAFRDIAETQIAVGDSVDARKTLLDALPFAKDTHALGAVAQAQVRAGDLVGARATADRITTDPWRRFDALKDLVTAWIKAGDLTAARDCIADARKTAASVQDASTKEAALLTVAADQTAIGDASGARETFGTALQAAGRLEDANQKAWAQKAVAVAQLEAGDPAAAQSTANLIADEEIRAAALTEIAKPPKLLGPESTAPQPRLAPPLPSEQLTTAPVPSAQAWIRTLEQSLSAPGLTAFPDFSDPEAIAAAVQAEPVRNGPIGRPIPLDRIGALKVVAGRMVAARKQVDILLKLQFAE